MLIIAMTAEPGVVAVLAARSPCPKPADRAASQNGRTIFTESAQAVAASHPKRLLALTEGKLGLYLFTR